MPLPSSVVLRRAVPGRPPRALLLAPSGALSPARARTQFMHRGNCQLHASPRHSYRHRPSPPWTAGQLTDWLVTARLCTSASMPLEFGGGPFCRKVRTEVREWSKSTQPAATATSASQSRPSPSSCTYVCVTSTANADRASLMRPPKHRCLAEQTVLRTSMLCFAGPHVTGAGAGNAATRNTHQAPRATRGPLTALVGTAGYAQCHGAVGEKNDDRPA